MHLTRYQMYNRIFSVLDLPLSGDILAISGIKYWQGSKNYTPLRKIIDDDARISAALQEPGNVVERHQLVEAWN